MREPRLPVHKVLIDVQPTSNEACTIWIYFIS
jgi:hypothetical protein